jgi:hypothetical protein
MIILYFVRNNLLYLVSLAELILFLYLIDYIIFTKLLYDCDIFSLLNYINYIMIL